MSSNLCSEEASDVSAVLDDIGIDEHSRDDHLLHIFNKADIADEAVDILVIQTGLNGRTMTCSALSGSGVDDLLNQIDQYFAQRDADCQIIINLNTLQLVLGCTSMLALLNRYNAEGQHIVRARLSPANKALSQTLARYRGPQHLNMTTSTPKSDRPEQKVILITGCSSGIGLDAALTMKARAGWL